ncbi:maltooligosyl trehalose synthase [Brevifollis gellanilyticus]|uniref:Maltooligosyl trehalose synthase n=2 Tax=Brevifollis gellanilyticus TaxID=748831 RepID=A0A512MEC0_9BACT|nr:maltooligosyl trehalose synthase [Brevifollis gellanilyticus]
MMSHLPSATYRFQFHQHFTFAHAKVLVPYLARLGISHVYASPIFRAAPGSMHGYDVSDHNELNPELGTREDFEALSAELQSHGLGFILDFVPNHMGIEHALNPWWRDVLESGPASPYAKYFDIDWQPLKRELENKVLLPVLGEQYGATLESGGFQIEFEGGDFVVRHGSMTLPLNPLTLQPLLREVAQQLSPAPPEIESIITSIDHLPLSTETAPERVAERVRERQIIRERLQRLCTEMPPVLDALQQRVAAWNDRADPMYADRLDQLLSAQPYRLSSWRVAGEEINYRRFFDVNTLAAIRMELPEVFDATHRLLFELMDAGHVTGVRIDHIDGLAAPQDYLMRLRERGGADLYLLVEKILGPDEKLRATWPVHGTTGYEFANQLVQLLVPPAGVTDISVIYDRFLSFRLDYREVIYRSKKVVMQSLLASETNVLGQLLNRISESHRWYRDFTVNALTAVVREVIACFPVYRTYLEPDQPVTESDVLIIRRAVNLARRRNRAMERTVFEFLRDVLLPPKDNAHPVDEELRRFFVQKFQQCTGPITAKGVEDTAFYVFNRLVALNEVGGEPAATGLTLEAFHRQNAARQAELPHTMLATSTHDTKRSEDVRARLAAIAELPEEWGRAVKRWQVMNRKHRQDFEGETAPDANEEYLLYQTLLGAWPLEGLHDGNREEFIQRIQDYMVKALHEAKVNSSWLEPNAAWDDAVKSFVAALLAPGRKNRFPQSISPLAERLAQLGMVNSLTQTVLKLTCPGVPDIYQGSELWDFSLVDPDNRRPVDYEKRQQALDGIAHATPGEMLEHWQDGRIKMFIIHSLLTLRRARPELFAKGGYTGLAATGIWTDKVVAFERRIEGSSMVVIVPRHVSELGWPPLGQAWHDTQLSLATAAPWRDVFTGREHAGAAVSLSELFAELPFAVLLA